MDGWGQIGMQHNEMLDNKSRCSGLRGIRARIIQTSSQLSYWCCVAVRRSLLPRDNQLLEMPAWDILYTWQREKILELHALSSHINSWVASKKPMEKPETCENNTNTPWMKLGCHVIEHICRKQTNTNLIVKHGDLVARSRKMSGCKKKRPRVYL